MVHLFEINPNLIFIGVLLVGLAYLIGVKKMTWLLSGFNERRVKNKEKLAYILGLYNLFVGIMFLAGGFIPIINLQYGIIAVVVGYLLLIAYVNKNMVE